MTHHLASLRFRSIGERSARFPDLTLDLTTPAGADRVADDSVIWLRNGGGKTSLLSLFYALLLPHANDFMSKTTARFLTDYVGTGDTSHTLAVWYPATAATLLGTPEHVLVTGAIYEWMDQRQPADPEKSRDRLNTYYYAFYEVPGVLEAATLPFEDEHGQPLRLAAFLAALKDRASGNSHGLDLVITNKQYAWTTELNNRGLDPEIFRTQKEMNHVEGGVEELFKFTSARQFINFLMDLTVPPNAASNVAERLSVIADLLATKPAKTEEHDFCGVSAAVLDRLAAAYTKVVTATDDLTQATRHGADLSASFTATIAEAQVALDAFGPDRVAVEATRGQASGDAAAAYLLAYLYQVRAAELRLVDAQANQAGVEAEVAIANQLVDAWKLTDQLGKRADLLAELAQVMAAAATERTELAPQRLEHDRHATRLLTRLETAIADALERAGRERETADSFREEAAQHALEATAARAALVLAAAAVAVATTQMNDLNADVRRAVQTGDLPSESIDPSLHRESLTKAQDQILAERETVRSRRKTRPVQRQRLTKTLTDLTGQQTQRDNERSVTAVRQDGLRERASKLAGNSRVRDLVEATEDAPVDLWGEAGTLSERLTNEVMNADEARIRLEAVRLDSTRVRDVHARTGFLPTSLDAERVIAVLAESGISSEPGWTHLRDLLSHDALMGGLEHHDVARLGCGVVIATDQEPSALRALAGLDTVTVSLVGVYTAAVAAELARTPAQAQAPAHLPAWLGLNRGMVDQGTANTTVNALAELDRSHTRQQDDLTSQRDADRELLDQCKAFLDDCPAGLLDQMTAELAVLDEVLEGIAREVSEVRKGLAELDTEETRDGDLENQLTDRVLHGETVLTRVAVLAEKVKNVPGWKLQQSDAEAAEREATAADADHTTKAQEATRLSNRHGGATDSANRDAADLRNAAVTVTFLDGRADPEPDDLKVTVDALWALFRGAQDDWKVKASQSVLADRESRLKVQLAAMKGTYMDADPATAGYAEKLLVSPSGQSIRGRAQALKVAEDAKTSASNAEGRANAAVDTASANLITVRAKRTAASKRPLPVEPASVAEADQFASEQEQAGALARALETEAETKLAVITAKESHLEGQVTTFGLLCDGLPGPTEALTAAFTGDEKAATVSKREAVDWLNTSNEGRLSAVSVVAGEMATLRETASKYPNVKTHARDRTAHDSEETLAPNAAGLAAQLRLRQDMITGELEGIAKDQDIVAESLVNLVKGAMDTLKKAERYSRLPATLGAWANQHMLRIKFDSPASDNDLRAQVNLVIDERVAAGVKAEGPALLKDAVHKAVGLRGFTVTVLKPTQDLTPIREDITRLARWSGGEKLTVCVALYCTIAALRAATTGHRDRSGGVLLLDNPIGRASYGSLVWLQRSVAKEQNVQLIFTTGVKDPDAVSQFPNIIRLDNRSGRTHARRYVVADETKNDIGANDLANLVNGTRISHTEDEEPAAGTVSDT